MSLIDEAMESCIIIDKVTENINDGYGGVTTRYRNGATFSAAFVFDDSTPAKIAAKDGFVDRYTVYTERTVVLFPGDHFKRVSDGRIYKVTSDGRDAKTPASASLNLAEVTAEEVKGLPNYDG